MSSIPTDAVKPGRASLFYDPKIRGYVYQIALLAVVAFLIWSAASNAIENLRAQKIASGFGFWDNAAGFDVNQTLIPFCAAASTYGQAFWVGLLNTLLVASIGIVLSTFLGFFVGVARLSSNWVLAKLAMIYVEVIRNLPLLLQLFFWYNAVLKPLPDARNSIALPGSIFLNNRGLTIPLPEAPATFRWAVAAILLSWIAQALVAAQSCQSVAEAQLQQSLEHCDQLKHALDAMRQAEDSWMQEQAEWEAREHEWAAHRDEAVAAHEAALLQGRQERLLPRPAALQLEPLVLLLPPPGLGQAWGWGRR